MQRSEIKNEEVLGASPYNVTKKNYNTEAKSATKTSQKQQVVSSYLKQGDQQEKKAGVRASSGGSQPKSTLTRVNSSGYQPKHTATRT